MSLSKIFKTNTDFERKGVDIEVAQNADGSWATFILARAGRNNPNYQRVAEAIMRPFRRAQQLGTLPSEKLDVLTREIFAQAGVIGWKNIPKGDVTGIEGDSVSEGKPVYEPYSKDAAIALFTNLPDLYSKLVELSVDHTTYTEGQREGDAGNLPKS